MELNKGKARMKPSEIQELLRLKGWSKTRLAAELDLTEHSVRGWLAGKRQATGPAAILMRMWLEEARDMAEAATA
jgi:DNA-binding transcriptional regulator YiaG